MASRMINQNQLKWEIIKSTPYMFSTSYSNLEYTNALANLQVEGQGIPVSVESLILE